MRVRGLLVLLVSVCFLATAVAQADTSGPSPILSDGVTLPEDIEATGNTAEVDALREWAEEHRQTYPEQALQVAERALALARELDDQREIGKSLETLGGLTSDVSEKESYYLAAQNTFERIGDESGSSRNQLYLGDVYWRRGRLEQALTVYLDALKGFERLNDTEGQARVLSTIGNLHKRQGNLEEALTYCQQAVVLAESFGDPVLLARNLSNLAGVLIELDSYEEAEDHLRRALTIVEEEGQQRFMAGMSNNLGHVYIEQGRYEHALPHLFTAERLGKELGENMILIAVYDELAKAHMGLGRYNEALRHGNESLVMAREMGEISFQREAHETLSRIYEAAGDYEQALSHYRRFTAAKDSIFNVDKTKIITEMQTRYETEGKQRDIERLEQENRIRALQAGRWRIWMFSGMGGLLLLLAFIFSRYRLKQRANRLLATKNEEIEVQRADLENSLAENKILLREVHHRVKNNLQVVTSLLNLQSDAVNDAPALAALRNTQSRVHAMALIHRLLLRKEGAPRIEMQDYIENLSEFLLHAFNSRENAVQCEVDAHDLTLDADTVVPLGLIFNELLSNALEHAFPEGREGRIRVAMEALGEGRYTVEVEDDGIGLPAHMGDGAPTGLGLQLVEQLVRQLDGAMDVTNGVGAHYTLRFHEITAS